MLTNGSIRNTFKPLFFIAFVFYGSILVSQTTENAVFSLGGALGINGCQVHGDSYSGYDKGGLFAGISVNAALTKNQSLELGFYFSQKGARHNADPEKGDYTSFNLRLNYLDMPLLYKLFVNKRFYITLGPSVAYLISSKEEVDSPNMVGGTELNKFEVGINAGLGVKANDRLFMEIRTSNSILPIHDYGVSNSNVYYQNPIGQLFNEGWYNNILTLFVSYKLNNM